MGRASTEIGMRFRVFDQTAAGFAAVKSRFAKWDKNSVLNKELNPLAGFGKTNLAKGAAAGVKDVAGVGKALGGGAAMAGRLAGSLAKAAATAAALGAAVAGIAAKKGLDAIFAMDEQGDAAQKIGLSVNGLKRMERVFAQAGLGGRELAEDIIPKMNRALGEKAGQDALGRIGLSFETLKAMSPEERFKAVGAAVAEVSNDLERAQLETDLFGRSGTQLDAIFRRGGKAFAESYESVGRLAGTLDEAGVAAAGRFADAWAVAKDRSATAWQNLMGGMLKSFEARFGRIDQWMLGMWEDMAASAKIVWLEISANGPAVFQTFFRNAGALASGFFKNWKEGFSWVFDTLITGATSMAMGFARLGKAVWASLKGDDADWAGVANAFKSVIPDYGVLADRLGVELEKTKLIDLSEEKARIRAAAAERKLQDRESLEAADRLQKQTSDNMSDGLIKGAQALKEAVKDSEAAAMGSYDAFRLVMGRAGAAQGAAAAAPLAGQGPAPGGAADAASGAFPAMLARLDTIIGYLRDGDRDRTYIRDAVESIGVA